MTFIDKKDGFFSGYMAGRSIGLRKEFMKLARDNAGNPPSRSYYVKVARSYNHEYLDYCRRGRMAKVPA